jgi:hypothetical protein
LRDSSISAGFAFRTAALKAGSTRRNRVLDSLLGRKCARRREAEPPSLQGE